MANQKDGVAPRGLSKKTKLILLIAGIGILLVVLAFTFFPRATPQKSQPAAQDPNSAAKSLDTRTAATQQASATANAQANNGDAAGAIKTLDAAIASTPASDISDLSALYQQKATVAANAGQRDLAVASQQAAIKLQPSDWKLVESLGNLYRFLKDTPNAIASYQQADQVLSKTKDYDTYHGRLLSDIARAKVQP